MKNNFLKIILINFVFLCSFSKFSYAQDLTVAAAANLQAVMEEIVPLFKNETGIDVKVVIGASGGLAVQIENGAPYDVFLSADLDYPMRLYKKGASMRPPVVYAYGTVILWTLKDIDLSRGVDGLVDPAIKKIAIANPDTSPYGREAVNALKYHKIFPGIQERLIYGQNISQTNQFIYSQTADIGFTAKSAVFNPRIKVKGRWIELDQESYNRIAQGAVISKYGEKNHPDESKEFLNFIFSKPVKKIFKDFGYTVDE